MLIKIIVSALILGVFTLATPAMGHESHAHEIDKNEAEVLANKSVSKLVDKGKIDKSWKTTKVSKSETKNFSNGVEWVVVYNNKSIKDPEKQTLFIFLSMDGEYLAANYTGN